MNFRYCKTMVAMKCEQIELRVGKSTSREQDQPLDNAQLNWSPTTALCSTKCDCFYALHAKIVLDADETSGLLKSIIIKVNLQVRCVGRWVRN